MKINVTGRGRIPGINALAPVYNRDADINLVKRILAFRVFRVFDATSGLQITSKNINEFVDTTPKKAMHIPYTPIPETATVTPTPVTEEEIRVDESVYEIPNTDETSDTDIVVAESEEVVTSSEEPVIVGIDLATNVDDVVVTDDVEVTTTEEMVDTTASTEDTNFRSKRKKRRH